MKKLFIISLLAFVGIGNSFAQHEVGPALASQLFSRLNFNPAGIGNNENVNIFSMSGLSWAGHEGQPLTTVLNVHYFNERIKSGFGASFMYDQLGSGNRAINAKVSYAYNLDLSDRMLLSFGLSAGIDQFGKDYSSERYNQSQYTLESFSKINPDFDFGIEFSMPNLLIGAAVTHIGFIKGDMIETPRQTYYGYVRGKFALSKELMLTPSFLYMHNGGLTDVFDVNAVFFYQQKYWAGLSYTNGFMSLGAGGLTLMAGMEWNWLRVGYAYKMGFDIGNYNSHELMLAFQIPTKSDKPKTDRKNRRRR